MKKENCHNCQHKPICQTPDMLISEERKSQDSKWGVQNHSDEIWLAILSEEVGEVSKEILEIKFGDHSDEDIFKELIQVAAVAKAWLECKLRNNPSLCKFFMRSS